MARGQQERTVGSAAAQALPTRRAALAAVAGGSVLALLPDAARADATTGPARTQDEGFMREALAMAAEGDTPFGTVIVRDGQVMARGPNLTRRLADPTAHGEMVAIRRFLAARTPEELKGTTLYSSGEPCAMCMGAILWCGIDRVVYGASTQDLAARITRLPMPALTIATAMAQQAPFLKVEITGGVLRDEALALFETVKTKP
ncbi:nucleoside deaminase [Xanthobacter sp. KR7-65]|uniref:nucleoside deaminase n=1 Tax=Xanthobacter sp. KR7-65 TaxID=3156612 RepID=UPI0032B492B6